MTNKEGFVMKDILKQIVKYLFLFILGGIIYMGIELIWRQETHWTMGILGGLCFIQLGLINEILPWEMPLLLQAGIGSVIITANEFIAGLIINVWLGLNVWDYSNLPFNVMGQICLLFCFLWVFIAILGIVVDDYVRYRFFNGRYPVYYLFGKKIVPFKYRDTIHNPRVTNFWE